MQQNMEMQEVTRSSAVSKSPYFSMPNMKKLGYFNIDGMAVNDKEEHPTAAFARMTESSKGKDTTIGHWEIAGIISKAPLPTYPNGFPKRNPRGILKTDRKGCTL